MSEYETERIECSNGSHFPVSIGWSSVGNAHLLVFVKKKKVKENYVIMIACGLIIGSTFSY